MIARLIARLFSWRVRELEDRCRVLLQTTDEMAELTRLLTELTTKNLELQE